MKKVFLLLLGFFLLTFCSAQFSAYHPFPHNNAYWRETEWWQAAGCLNMQYVGVYNHYDYYVNGDTIVRGNTYIKVRTSGGYEDAPPCPPPIVWLNYDRLACIMREDTAAQKVYASFPPQFATDTLLYDFTLKQGDYMPRGYFVRMDSTFIYSVDSVLVGSSYRKKFVIASMKSSPYIFDSIIEGIGAETGLLEAIVIPFESGSDLDCFDNTSINLVYPNGDSCSRFYLSVPEIKNPVYTISVYPNPNNGIFTLVITSEAKQSLPIIEVYNVLGEKVYTSTLPPPNGGGASYTYPMNLSSHPNGIYLYRVITGDGSLMGEGKLVIER